MRCLAWPSQIYPVFGIPGSIFGPVVDGVCEVETGRACEAADFFYVLEDS